jgi:hypothetical protein
MQLEEKGFFFLYNQTNSDREILLCRRKKDISKKIAVCQGYFITMAL